MRDYSPLTARWHVATAGVDMTGPHGPGGPDPILKGAMMRIEQAQADMRQAYGDGGTGVLASAIAWLAAAIAAGLSTPMTAIATLLIGGMLIFPLSVLLSKLLGQSGAHSKGNPLASLAGTGTAWMLMCIPIAYGAALYRVEWFFPAMLLIIGGRYLTFSTLYGLKVYLILGASLALAGIVSVVSRQSVLVGALAGSLIELAFAILILLRFRRFAPA